MARTSKKTAPAKAEKTPVKKDAEAQAPAISEDNVSQLTIADLQTLAGAIDIASRRGAYGAAEMADVGAVYKKLTGFLQLIADQQRNATGE